MDKAQRREFTVRRVEFVGLTYTHDHILRDRMTPIVNEGDVFTRDKLVRSLRSMSTLERAIFPLRVENVVIQLDTSHSSVDMIICFRQRPRRVAKPPANKSLQVSAG
jgi:outer membrane protein assembly factor BamA